MAPSRRREKSPSSTPVPSTEAQNDGSQLPDAEWDAMQKVLTAIYDYRTEDGLDPSSLFKRKVNKRVLPEYYETIKEPMALSTIKQKVHTRTYSDFAEFVRDFALIPHNAQVFNRPDSGAFQDALVIKEQLEKHLQLLVESNVITREVAALPDLGEIPTYEDVPPEEAEVPADEEDSSDDEGEEDDEDDGEEDDDGKKKRRAPRGRASIAKRDTGDDAIGKSRARPPKLQTPTEARTQAVLKGIRKPKDPRGRLMIKSFDRLPDKQALPDYYIEVKQPIAYDLLKRKFKRKKYGTLEAFMADVNLMFDNAKSYNTDESQIYADAVALQRHAGKLYDEQRAKPDDSFVDDEGKIPVPNGVLHNGELYKVGDWVHIRNPNDLTKPVPAQIYRIYKLPNQQQMVNVCWYYRPEQTVHRFDKHFLANEVVKTGRYRDHHVEEIEGRCFIMFTTRYFKGRPRGLAEGTEIYVCEARYNERDHQFNKIKTWASCQPDEVRDRDYEMDLFERPRQYKKFPSDIAYLLKPEQKDTDDLPKVQWGAEGAPPKVGAVHRRPRGERDSLPPEPTPPPQPKVETPAPSRPVATTMPSYGSQTPGAQSQQTQRPPLTTTGATRPQSFGASHPQSYMQTGQSPAPPRPSSQASMAPQTPHQNNQAVPPRTAPIASHSSSYGQPQQPASTIPSNPSTYATAGGRPSTSSYRDPPPIEVYTLPDQANMSIPIEVRMQYLRDDRDRVYFFTTPPTTVIGSAHNMSAGHSIRYLAAKARRQDALAQKRKVWEEEKQSERRVAKKARLEELESVEKEVEVLKRRALKVVEDQLRSGAVNELEDVEIATLSAAQKSVLQNELLAKQRELARAKVRTVKWDSAGGRGVFEDDWDTRLVA